MCRPTGLHSTRQARMPVVSSGGGCLSLADIELDMGQQEMQNWETLIKGDRDLWICSGESSA